MRLIALLAAAVFATSAWAAVPAPPTVYLNVSGGGHCTAFYIGDDRLATAAHCIKIGRVGDGPTKLGVPYVAQDESGNDVGTADTVDVYSEKDDLVVLHMTETPNLIPAILDCEPVRVGQDIIVRGFPGPLGLITTWGKVSALAEARGHWKLAFVMTAPIDAGNSGGPVFDAATGEVVGVAVGGYQPRDHIYHIAVPASSLCNLLKG